MSAVVQRRRKLTAKETAKRLGISERTVQRLVAEAREDYEGRASQRKETAGTMREAGADWDAIAEAIDGTTWAARSLVRRWKVEQAETEKATVPIRKKVAP
jgi:DNA-binding transcriptional regulator LsrR (DeoR family)